MLDQEARIAFNRFGLGPRHSARTKVANPRRWLKEQIQEKEVPLDPSIELPEPSYVAQLYQNLRQARINSDMEMQAETRKSIVEVTRQEIQHALTQRITSSRPFAERLVAFWSNHLCISITGGKIILGGFAGAYEREVIRPHVFGKYEDMVLASAKHPAMLIYLDNAQSIGPNSRAGKRLSQRRQQGGPEVGLNENYARELLELHTLGVDGGYDQDDVRQLAEILTGWGLDRGSLQQQRVAFRFNPGLHEPGNKKVLSKQYNGSGITKGERVIRDLVHHPSTARFIASKLASHFIADDPPEQAVQKLEHVFKKSGGDLYKVSMALLDVEEAWDPAYKKFKTPQEWLISVGRALGVDESPRLFPMLLTQLRQPMWAPPSPKGYGDTIKEWADPDALMNRAELSRSIAKVVANRITAPGMLVEFFGLESDSHLADMLNESSTPKTERIALAFAAPAFQWR